MLHVRLIAPPETTSDVLELLDASPAVTHLCVNEQSARKPSGDVVSFDVAREGATSVLEALRGFGLERDGAIVVENLDISISDSAIKAEEETPGEPADAVVWEGLEQSAGEETRLSITYLCFMMVATMIAAIGVMLDQPILIVGAMVVGPEFGPLVGILRWHRERSTAARHPGAGHPGPRLCRRYGSRSDLDMDPDRRGTARRVHADSRAATDELYLEARCPVLDRWFLGRHRWHAGAYLGQVRCFGRRPDLGDDYPGRGQRGSGACLLGTERSDRVRHPAGDQLVRHRGWRNAYLVSAQATLRAARTAVANRPYGLMAQPSNSASEEIEALTEGR